VSLHCVLREKFERPFPSLKTTWKTLDTKTMCLPQLRLLVSMFIV